MRRSLRLFSCLSGLLTTALMATPAQAQHGAHDGQWRSYTGDLGSTKYAALDQIDRDNVQTLRIAWRRPAVDARLMLQIPTWNSRTTFDRRR